MSEMKAPQSKESGAVPLVGSRRLNAVAWSQHGDRQLCQWAYYEAPDGTPHVHRQHIASPRLIVVDRTNRSALLCNGLHEGDCRWPGGEGIGEIDEARDSRILVEVAAMGGGSPQSSASPPHEAPLTNPVPPRRR